MPMPASCRSTRAGPPRCPAWPPSSPARMSRASPGPIRPLIPTTAAVSDYCLAVDRARYVGEPVAAVAAVDRATAEDALERIEVVYEPLPPVVDPEEALKPGAPLLYPELGTNVVWHDTLTYGDVDGAMARAHGVLRERFTIQRYASTPARDLRRHGRIRCGHGQLRVLDQRSAAGADHLDPGRRAGRPAVAHPALLPRHRRRLRQQAPAGVSRALRAAGAAGGPPGEVDRGSRGEPHRADACRQRRDGRGAGVRGRRHAPGAERPRRHRRGQEPLHPHPAQPHQAGQYRQRLPHPRHPLRGLVGAHHQVPERRQPRHRQALHVLRGRARHGAPGPAAGPGSGGAAPAQLRHRRARCPTPRRPARSTTAATTRPRCAARWSASTTRAGAPEQAQARKDGRLLGIGIATSIEPAGTNLASYELLTGRRTVSGSAEACMVRMEPDGQVRVSIGDPSSGQGYETVIAQIVADELGLTPADVAVARGFDSATTPWLYLSGNYSNKFSVTDTGAIVGAARRVARQAPPPGRASPGDRPRRSGAARRRRRGGGRARPAHRLRRARAHRLRRRARPAAGGRAGPRGPPRALESARDAGGRAAPPALPARLRQRRALLPGRGAPAHRRGHRAQVPRRARLRPRAQSPHRGGHGARLHRARDRRRAARGVPLRRAGAIPHLHLPRLPQAHRHRRARDRGGAARAPLPVHPAGRQGRGRGRRHPGPGGGGQCRRGCAGALRRDHPRRCPITPERVWEWVRGEAGEA